MDSDEIGIRVGRGSSDAESEPIRARTQMSIIRRSSVDVVSERRSLNISRPSSSLIDDVSGVPTALSLILDKWIVYSTDHAAQHTNAWMFYRRFNIFTAIPSMVLSGLSGISIIGFGPHQSCSGSNVVYYVSGIMGIVSGILIAINKFARVVELQELHSTYADQYEVLHNDIIAYNVMTYTEESVFKNKIEFVKWIKARLNTLIEKSPPIPNIIKTIY